LSRNWSKKEKVNWVFWLEVKKDIIPSSRDLARGIERSDGVGSGKTVEGIVL